MNRQFEDTHRKKRYGRCRICQKFTKLTKEHVPPAKAFNDKGFLRHYVDEFAQAKRIRWEVKEEDTNGIYLFTLCEKCNNRTGTIYGTDYVKFVQSIDSIAILQNANKTVKIELNNFFPARVIKQAISMVLSTSKPTSFKNHAVVSSPLVNKHEIKGINISFPDKKAQLKIYDKLRKFVKNREVRGLPPQTKLYTFASVKTVGFNTGIFLRGNLKNKKIAWVVVTGLHPIHWVLVIDGEIDESLLDVTDWANYGYKEKQSKEIEIPCYWLTGKYPLDFRTPQEQYESHFLNSMSFEGFIPSEGLTRDQVIDEAVL